MIRVSRAQLSLLEQNLAGQAPAVIKAGRRRQDLPENMLEKQICDFLAWRGFTSTRQHVGTFVPYRLVRQIQAAPEAAVRNIVRIGEVGAADWWSVRPIIAPGGRALDGPWPWAGFFWEAKAPGKRPTEVQLSWMQKRRQVGLTSQWFDQFQAGDRETPAVEPRDSHVFAIWFLEYFERGRGCEKESRRGA